MARRVWALVLLSAAFVLPGCAGDDATEGVTVMTSEMRFSPSKAAVPAGPNTFTVTNTGEIRHTFSLNAIGEEVTVQPGQTRVLTVELEPGRYPYVCRILDHEGLGMRGVLTVNASN